MKENYFDITFILDESGSMSRLRSDVINGINTYIDDQKKIPGELKISIYKFNHHVNSLYIAKDSSEVNHLTNASYAPKGFTAIYDAICTAVDDIGKRLSALDESERPEKVVVIIQTDGEENSSQKFSLEDTRKRIIKQTDEYSWEFVFLGADIDAIAVANNLGIESSNAIKYRSDVKGMGDICASLSFNTTMLRSKQAANMAYTDADRSLQAGA